MGKKLLFIDVVESDGVVQVMVDLATLQKRGVSLAEVDDLRRRMAVGDHYGAL